MSPSSIFSITLTLPALGLPNIFQDVPSPLVSLKAALLLPSPVVQRGNARMLTKGVLMEAAEVVGSAQFSS